MRRWGSGKWKWTGVKKSPDFHVRGTTSMDRTRGRGTEPGPAMRADGDLALRAVLQGPGREGGEPGADALAGRAVHAHAVLWGAADELVAGAARLWGEREASAAADAADGAGSDLSETAAVGGDAGTPPLPLPPAGDEDRTTEPGLGQRHHLYSSAAGVYLSGGDPGLVQSLRTGLGSVDFIGERLLLGGAGVGLEDGVPGDLQYRSRGAVHERGFHRTAGRVRDHDQHGRAGPSHGQHFCGAVVAKREIRRGLSERLRAGVGGGEESGKLFSVLQSGAPPSGLGLSDAGGDLLRKRERRSRRDKTEDAVSRVRWRSSFLGDLSAKFWCGKLGMGLKKEKRRKKERKKGLWKLTPRMEIRRERGFPPRLENSLANNDRLFHSSHRPDDGDKVMTFFRQRSTLRKLIFCPKNGEHLKVCPNASPSLLETQSTNGERCSFRDYWDYCSRACHWASAR